MAEPPVAPTQAGNRSAPAPALVLLHRAKCMRAEYFEYFVLRFQWGFIVLQDSPRKVLEEFVIQRKQGVGRGHKCQRHKGGVSGWHRQVQGCFLGERATATHPARVGSALPRFLQSHSRMGMYVWAGAGGREHCPLSSILEDQGLRWGRAPAGQQPLSAFP